MSIHLSIQALACVCIHDSSLHHSGNSIRFYSGIDAYPNPNEKFLYHLRRPSLGIDVIFAFSLFITEHHDLSEYTLARMANTVHGINSVLHRDRFASFLVRDKISGT